MSNESLFLPLHFYLLAFNWWMNFIVHQLLGSFVNFGAIFIASRRVFTLTSVAGLLWSIKMNESYVGWTGEQKCCYGVGGLESVLYASRYQTCVGKVGAVVIHLTYRLASHFSVRYLISNKMTQEKWEQCGNERVRINVLFFRKMFSNFFFFLILLEAWV